jgi:hypothetical protein
MKYLLLLSLIICGTLWSAASNKKVYIPIASGKSLGDIAINTSSVPNDAIGDSNSFYIQKTTARRSGHIPQGSQRDIATFNKEHNYRSVPFGNKTNSYWLFPGFQFGPGSVNDFGGNPSAEQMLGPYIF